MKTSSKFAAFLMIASIGLLPLFNSGSLYAQDHNSIRGRLNLVGSSGKEAFDLNLIRTGPDANKVIFSWGTEAYFNDDGYGRPSGLVHYPYDSKGPSASFLIFNMLDGVAVTITRVEFTVYVMLEQKNVPMGDWPLEIWQVIVDLEPGATSYRVEGVRIR